MKDLVAKYCHLMDHSESFERILERVDAVLSNSTSQSPLLEIGVNQAGSSLCFLELLKKHDRKNWFYTVDPYGSIPYHNGGYLMSAEQSQYPDSKYRAAMKDISAFVFENDLNWQHFRCTSEDFADLSKFYKIRQGDEVKNIDKFLFIFHDGDHEVEQICKELPFLLDSLEVGGLLIIDDINLNDGRDKQIIETIGKHRNKESFVIDQAIPQRICISMV